MSFDDSFKNIRVLILCKWDLDPFFWNIPILVSWFDLCKTKKMCILYLVVHKARYSKNVLINNNKKNDKSLEYSGLL